MFSMHIYHLFTFIGVDNSWRDDFLIPFHVFYGTLSRKERPTIRMFA
jgi:hypothetical protein